MVLPLLTMVVVIATAAGAVQEIKETAQETLKNREIPDPDEEPLPPSDPPVLRTITIR